MRLSSDIDVEQHLRKPSLLRNHKI